MKTEELLVAVNVRVTPRYGSLLTAAALEDWVREGVVTGPTGIGRGRGRGVDQQWPVRSLRQATRIAWLKSQGVSRFAAIRTQLWISGLLEVPLHQRRSDVQNEFRRARRKTLRSRASTDCPTSENGAPSEMKDLMCFGESGAKANSAIAKAIDQLGVVKERGSASDLQTAISSLLNLLLGEPTEASDPETDQSAESMIGKAKSNHWEQARLLLQQLPWMMWKGHPLLLLALQLSLPSRDFSQAFKSAATAIAGYEGRLPLLGALLGSLSRGTPVPYLETVQIMPHIRSMLSAAVNDRRSTGDMSALLPHSDVALLFRSSDGLLPEERARRLIIKQRLQKRGLDQVQTIVGTRLRKAKNGQ